MHASLRFINFDKKHIRIAFYASFVHIFMVAYFDFDMLINSMPLNVSHFFQRKNESQTWGKSYNQPEVGDAQEA